MIEKALPQARPEHSTEDAFYSTTEAARLLGVCNTTVQIMAEKGVLRAWKTLGGIVASAANRWRRCACKAAPHA